MKNFPDFHESCFDITEYNKIFKEKNVIIHASAKDVAYDKHWGPLSIKCAVKGIEHYQCGNRFYSVHKDCYLIFNSGQYYSSYIYSDATTESFTINFSGEFQRNVLQSFTNKLDDEICPADFEFIEKLYGYNNHISPLLNKLYKATITKNPDAFIVTEIYYELLENLLLQQTRLKGEIKKVDAVKYSTQVEIYKRLNYAKDYIHSCYMHDVGLNKLASVACMNDAHFLRAFKKYFGSTPYQYIITQRLQAAKKLLETSSLSITETCFAVGYSDVTSFTKLFKKNFSCTPAEYQSNNKKSHFSPVNFIQNF
jgi:AraC family transcriptional regulator